MATRKCISLKGTSTFIYHLTNTDWLAKLMYLADIFGILTEMNFNLQDRAKTLLHKIHNFVYMYKSHAINQVISHWHPIIAAWIPTNVKLYGI
jgi:hypothetical protein